MATISLRKANTGLPPEVNRILYVRNLTLSESRIEVAVRHIYNILSHVPPLESADKESSYETWSQLGFEMPH